MKILKALSAATSLILIGSTNVAPATQMSTQSAQPEYESATVIEETIEESVYAEIDNDSPAPPYAEKKSYDSMIIDGNDDTVLPEKIKDPLEDLGPAIVEYYTIPGDMKTYGETTLSFSHYQKVTETADGKNYRLSGWTIAEGDWVYTMDMGGNYVSSEGIPPFDVYTDAVLAPPLAAVRGPLELNGFTFEAASTETVSYYSAYGCFFIKGDNWSAEMLDYTRYGEIKHGRQNGNIPDDYDLECVASNGEYWVMATDGAPAIISTTSISDTKSFYEEVEQACWSPAGVTDPRYGVIHWENATEECGYESSTYRIGGNLNGVDFEIEINGADCCGFCAEYEWTGAIVPADVVTHRNRTQLHIKGYTLSMSPNGRQVYVYDNDKEEGHLVDSNMANDQVVLVTMTDGKHAVVATFDAALLGYIWSLSFK